MDTKINFFKIGIFIVISTLLLLGVIFWLGKYGFEKKKYDALVERAMLFSTTPYYINSTPDGIWAFDLMKLPQPKWEERSMPKTTFFADNNNVMKVVGYINISQGMRLL